MANEQAKFEDGQGMQITPKGVALMRTVVSSLSTSQEIILNTSTKFLRCYALTQDVYLRWGIENCNAQTFDEVIPAGQVVDVAVPDDKLGNRFTAVNFIERSASASLIVIEK
jgi:hypothetical protein